MPKTTEEKPLTLKERRTIRTALHHVMCWNGERCEWIDLFGKEACTCHKCTAYRRAIKIIGRED